MYDVIKFLSADSAAHAITKYMYLTTIYPQIKAITQQHPHPIQKENVQEHPGIESSSRNQILTNHELLGSPIIFDSKPNSLGRTLGGLLHCLLSDLALTVRSFDFGRRFGQRRGY